MFDRGTLIIIIFWGGTYFMSTSLLFEVRLQINESTVFVANFDKTCCVFIWTSSEYSLIMYNFHAYYSGNQASDWLMISGLMILKK